VWQPNVIVNRSAPNSHALRNFAALFGPPLIGHYV